jgi:hypothetical protein
MATGQGTIVFDFGAAPGTNVVQTVVVDAAISSGSKVEIYLMGTSSTATHNAYEHSLLPFLDGMALSCVSVTASTGFTGQMATKLRLTGTIEARYVWAD